MTTTAPAPGEFVNHSAKRGWRPSVASRAPADAPQDPPGALCPLWGLGIKNGDVEGFNQTNEDGNIMGYFEI